MHHLSGNEETEVAAIRAENHLEHETSNEFETADNEHDDGHANADDIMGAAETVGITETEEVVTIGNEAGDIQHVEYEESDGNQKMAESTEEPNETDNTSDHNERDINFDNEENGFGKVSVRKFKSFRKSISIRTILHTFVLVNLIYVELIEMQRTILFHSHSHSPITNHQ